MEDVRHRSEGAPARAFRVAGGGEGEGRAGEGAVYAFPRRAAVFLLGFCAVVAQVIFFREFLVVFLGNELSAGVVFFSWFLGVGLGAAAAARPARRAASGEKAFVLLGALLVSIAPVLLILTRLARSILGVPSGAYIPFATLIAASAALIVPFSFLAGLVFPFACLLPLGPGEGARNIGRAYVIESLGSIAGGAAFTFALVGRVPAVETLCGCAAAFCIALCLLPRAGARAAAGTAGVCAAAWAAALVCGAAGRAERWSVERRWEALSPGVPLVASVDSRYENIALGRRAGQYDVFGSGQYYFSFPDPYGAAQAAHMIMTEHPAPRRVLLVGGGLGGMLQAILAHRPASVTCVELDPALIGVTEPRLDPDAARALRDPAVRVRFGDGRRYVKRTSDRFDMAIVAVPDPSTAMLNRFYTLEFYREARAILAPGGVLAARLSAPADYYGGEVGDYAGSVYATIRAVFPHVVVAPGEENWFFASSDPGAVTSDLGVLGRRWEGRRVETAAFSSDHLLSWWLPERVGFTRGALDARRGARLNTDFRPVTYSYNLLLWARFSGSSIASAMGALGKARFGWYLLPIVALAVPRLAWILARRGRGAGSFDALLSIGAVGFSAMALEIVLIFAFQNVYGYVYAMIGLIVAFFMAGLACGGFVGSRLAARAAARRACLAAVVWMLAAHAAAVPWIVRLVTPISSGSEYAFLALVWFTGALTGAAFPLAAGIRLGVSGGAGGAAARVNALDNLGACAGSLLAGVVFVPLLGLASSCLLIALLDAACGVLLLADGCRSRP